MTPEEFYVKIRGDYDEALARLADDELIVQLAELFLEDTNYADLLQAVDNNDTESAFRAVHSLKGASSNLSYTALAEVASRVTELLRVGDLEEAKLLLPELKVVFEDTVNGINELIG